MGPPPPSDGGPQDQEGLGGRWCGGRGLREEMPHARRGRRHERRRLRRMEDPEGPRWQLALRLGQAVRPDGLEEAEERQVGEEELVRLHGCQPVQGPEEKGSDEEEDARQEVSWNSMPLGPQQMAGTG